MWNAIVGLAEVEVGAAEDAAAASAVATATLVAVVEAEIDAEDDPIQTNFKNMS